MFCPTRLPNDSEGGELGGGEKTTGDGLAPIQLDVEMVFKGKSDKRKTNSSQATSQLMKNKLPLVTTTKATSAKFNAPGRSNNTAGQK
jgi:hypothetical protein